MSNKLNRKDLLLLLLFSPGSSGEEAEPIDGRTRLMKLLFLLQFQADYPVDKILEAKSKYEFQAYHYGPFTKDVYNDLEFLENVGLIEVNSKGIAGPADQNEEEKLVEDTAIGEDSEDTTFEFKEEMYKLTPRGLEFVRKNLSPTTPEDLLRIIRELKGKFASLPLTSLLRYVYSNYPDYAKKSKLTYLISS
jgi:uncharacterized protein YwgA